MLLAVLIVAAAPSAWAVCNLDTQIVGHTLGGWIENCPDAAPIEGYIWLLSSPGTVNSNGQAVVCRNSTEVLPESLFDCAFAPFTGPLGNGDGIVSVQAEWGAQNPTIPGCPNQAQAGDGTLPMGIQVVCNNGATAYFEVGWFGGLQQYALELATADGAGVSAIAPGQPGNALQLSSVGAGPSPSAKNVCIHASAPRVYSDCDPGTMGQGNSCIDTTNRPAFQPSVVMVKDGPCGQNPDLAAAGWIQATNQLDAAGNACNVVNPAPGSCSFVGLQYRRGAAAPGTTVGGIGAWVPVGEVPTNDKVKIDGASTAQGKVKVDFSTINETSIVGFNVYSDGAKLNGSLITSKGAGNNAYSFEVGRGALKGGKSVLVEAVKKDGTVEKTAPVSLK
jgi:hypothetical protein